jgi:hypothetical protein
MVIQFTLPNNDTRIGSVITEGMDFRLGRIVALVEYVDADGIYDVAAVDSDNHTLVALGMQECIEEANHMDGMAHDEFVNFAVSH